MSVAVLQPARRASLAVARPWPVRDETLVVRNIVLDNGTRLDRIDVRFRLEGQLNSAKDNLVVIVHALTGTPEASDWWKGVIGDGEAIDPRKHAILCANLLGGCAGTSGPRIDDDELFPSLTTRDQARVLERVIDALGVTTPLLICGGSLGGMVTLEFAATFPDRVRQAVVFAAPAAQTAQGLAWHAIMRRAVALGGPQEGLALARMVGMLSYRTPESLESRFGRTTNEDGLFEVNEWLYTHGDRLVQRFDARSYVGLIDAMDAHDVGRGRGGIAAALSRVGNRIIGVGIPGDILFTAESVREWCTESGATYRDLPSPFGHDAFLLETTAVSAIIVEALLRSSSVETLALHASADSLFPAETIASASPLTSRAYNRPEAGAAHVVKPLRIALAGCGHVGGALLDLLNSDGSSNNRQTHVARVLVRDASRVRPALTAAVLSGLSARDACITNAETLLNDDVDVLVEVIGGTTTAATLVESALKRGIRVVTANKALLATRGPALVALAEEHNTTLDFEGAVAAAVPIVRCLRAGAAGVGITRIAGVVNGTTNVVLERVAAGDTLQRAMAYAQAEGFAEADPTRDLSGEDAEDKLRVLAWLAFGVDPASLRVARRGIDAEVAEWAKQAAVEGDSVKLIATCTKENGGLVARVTPTRVVGSDAWASVHGPANRIAVDSASAGTLVFHGPGAGGRATAGAVFGDVFRSVMTTKTQ